MEIPMLNEHEYSKASELYKLGFRKTKGGIENRFSEILNYYNELTGWNETVANAIMHHRIEDFGADCPNCSKPLRTKKARYCVECGFGKEDFID